MPIVLSSNRPRARFYRGGARIGAFRGEPVLEANEPEDWIASTTTVRGEGEVGLTKLPGGRSLRSVIEEDPVAWLGVDHAGRWGADTRLLVKLLDAGQRLPVHAHPHDDFARTHLGCSHGKAEAWYILEGGVVHLGLRREVEPAELDALVRDQDVAGMIALLHEIEVSVGDVVWVPPGELHAIGAGVLLLELQQPEDLSILLERRGFDIADDEAWHLGLGAELALDAVNHAARSSEELTGHVRPAPVAGSVLPAAADQYFRLERVIVDDSALVAGGFAIVVVIAGDVVLGSTPAPCGSALLVAASEGDMAVSGRGEVLVARPPAA